MDIVRQFYDEHAEQELGRLDRHRTEFAVSLRAIRTHLPAPPCTILDIGGGPGRYALELARDGHRVSMADVSEASLALARAHAGEAGLNLEAYYHSDARDLHMIPDSAFDAVLLMGPLYHLQQAKERRKAVLNSQRILKPGGLLFAAFITRFAPFRNAACLDPGWLLDNKDYAFDLLKTGVHNRGENFPHAYFTHPGDIRPFMEANGFETQFLIGCEGIVSGFEDIINTFEGEAWEVWVEMNYRLGQEPSLYGAADHLLYIGRKPSPPGG